MRMHSICTGTHRHARHNPENGINRHMVERGSAGVDDAGTEESKDFNVDVQDCSRKRQKQRTGLVQDEMGKLVHYDEQELLSMWEGRHWDVNKGGWLDPGAVRQGKT